ncbi:ABC transporter permease [Wukongibacter sp. M2B1]|uniref:ABC transporter permease n=1 Tax=Wukongibacter sp. M2B1 TaxID=3088895 RepID=UPI003D7BFF1D
MHYAKIWKLLQASGIFILIFCIFLIEGIDENTIEALGTISSKRISIEAKENFINNREPGFNEKEIYQLKNNSKNNLCSFVLPFEANIKTSSNNILIKALAVNSSYENFANINIINGSFLSEKGEKNKERNLIIEETTALKLFKSTDVVGMNLELMNEDFRIVGIYKSKTSFLHRLVRKKEPKIYITLKAFFSLNKDITIPCFQITTSNEDGSIQNKKDVVNLLENIGKSSANYKIVDYRNLLQQALQTNQLITFIFGILIIIGIIRLQVRMVKEMYLTIEKNYSLQYFYEAIKSSKKILVYLTFKLLFLAFSIYLVIQVVKFDLYIYYTNNNLIKCYFDFISNTFFEIGASKLVLDCLIHFSMLIISFVFTLGIPLGVILLLSSFYFLKYTHFSLDKALLFFSITYILSLLIASIIIKIINLPLIMNTKSITIIYIFIFLKNTLVLDKI